MSKLEPQYLVSTDSIGFFGRPEQFIKLWKEYFDDKTLDGVEVIAFKPINRLNKLISIFKKNNIPVLSFHGKTGDVKQLSILKRITLYLVNTTFVNTNKLLRNFSSDKDILFHTSLTKIKNIEKIVIENLPKKLWIENNPSGKKEAEETINQIINYRKKGVRTYGMFDIFHFIRNLSMPNLKNDWPNVVKQIEYYVKLKDRSGTQFFTGIHFPIGTRLADSLPIDDMTDKMLKQFAQKIIPHVERIVFENQQTLLGLFFSTNKMLEEQKRRNIRIIQRLKKTGIIMSGD